jgi:hypothetical protein
MGIIVDVLEVDVLGERHVLVVGAEHLEAVDLVGNTDDTLPVEAAKTLDWQI